jgi:hypothetical protein
MVSDCARPRNLRGWVADWAWLASIWGRSGVNGLPAPPLTDLHREATKPKLLVPRQPARLGGCVEERARARRVGEGKGEVRLSGGAPGRALSRILFFRLAFDD